MSIPGEIPGKRTLVEAWLQSHHSAYATSAFMHNPRAHPGERDPHPGQALEPEASGEMPNHRHREHPDLQPAEPDASREEDADLDDGGGAMSVNLIAGRPPKASGSEPANASVRPRDSEHRRPQQKRRLTLEEAVVRYAPLVFLASDETYGPANASAFIRHSSLDWYHDEGYAHEVVGQGEVNEKKLSSGEYTEREMFSGIRRAPAHHGRKIHSNEDVRPMDGSGDGGNEGFFLDLDNNKRKTISAGTDAPVYFEAVNERYITYWFFYAYNEGPFTGAFGIGGGIDNHEGDWERITVDLNRNNRATAVTYHQHSTSETRRWSKVPKQGTHPIVYSAKGSHASYPTMGDDGEHTVGPSILGVDTATDHTSRGAQWETWKHLRNARTRNWYEYGGAWGEVGRIDATTGPQGPSHK